MLFRNGNRTNEKFCSRTRKCGQESLDYWKEVADQRVAYQGIGLVGIEEMQRLSLVGRIEGYSEGTSNDNLKALFAEPLSG